MTAVEYDAEYEVYRAAAERLAHLDEHGYCCSRPRWRHPECGHEFSDTPPHPTTVFPKARNDQP